MDMSLRITTWKDLKKLKGLKLKKTIIGLHYYSAQFYVFFQSGKTPYQCSKILPHSVLSLPWRRKKLLSFRMTGRSHY